MRKIFVVARRDYLAAVKTKAFILSVVLMPLMMGGSVLVQFLLKDMVDTKEKHFAVVDRTPGEQFARRLEQALDEPGESERSGGSTFPDVGVVEPKKPAFVVLERVSPEDDAKRQRYDLSERVRAGELFGFLEIESAAEPNDLALRYQSNSPRSDDFRRWAAAVVWGAVRARRGADARLTPEQTERLARPVLLETKGLSRINPETGEVVDAGNESRFVSFVAPFALMMLMFMMTMMSATPLMQSVVEEKMQRIAEVLLGSVRPFDLMLGKLLGSVAVSLTVVAIYLGGGYWAVWRSGYGEYLPLGILPWFLVFQVLATLMFGSLFIAVGAACTDLKETQTLMWPVMLLAVLPMFVIGTVLTNPQSTAVAALSFFPPATPTLMIARLAIPPGVPWWQPAVGSVLVLLTTLACVYAAGRVFRVGLLMQGKGARPGDVVKWVVRG